MARSRGPSNAAPFRQLDDVTFGDDVVVHSFTNMYGCRIGTHSRVGTFVEIQRGAEVGANCKTRAIPSFATGCESRTRSS
jgi:UDP-2-acetamido-3-amino-2,3-dideoxy-glucuronate N-acetyltransferase